MDIIFAVNWGLEFTGKRDVGIRRRAGMWARDAWEGTGRTRRVLGLAGQPSGPHPQRAYLQVKCSTENIDGKV